MNRKIISILTAASLMLFVASCFVWVRSTSGVDEAAIRYDRYLADGSAASNSAYLTSDHRLWLAVHWGSVGPYKGQLVWGYHVNADQSGGKPRLIYNRSPYATGIFSFDGRLPTDDRAMSGWGPLRWQDFHRSGNGEQFRSLTIGVSPWLLASLFLVLTMRGLYVLRRSSKGHKVAVLNGEQNDAPELPSGRNLISASFGRRKGTQRKRRVKPVWSWE